jgi:hypothetical protein
MKRSRTFYLCATCILVLACGLYPGAQEAYAVQPRTANAQTSVAQVDQWLAVSNYVYKKTGNGTWLITYRAKTPTELWVLVAAGTDFVVVGVVVALKRDMVFTNDFMFKLLRLNHALDYVKIGFDNDEDLFVRSEVKTKGLDLQDFKTIVETVATATDTLKGEIKPFLKSP